MEQENNFKAWEEELIRNHRRPPAEVGNNLRQNMGFFRLFGDLFELYMPKMFKIIVQVVGGSEPVTRAPRRQPPNTIQEQQ